MSEVNSIFNKNTSLIRISNTNFKGDKFDILKYCDDLFLSADYRKLLFSFFLSKYSSHFESKSDTFFKNETKNRHYVYNLSNLLFELKFDSFLVKFKNGNFFFDNFSFDNLNYLSACVPEFGGLVTEVSNQLASAK